MTFGRIFFLHSWIPDSAYYMAHSECEPLVRIKYISPFFSWSRELSQKLLFLTLSPLGVMYKKMYCEIIHNYSFRHFFSNRRSTFFQSSYPNCNFLILDNIAPLLLPKCITMALRVIPSQYMLFKKNIKHCRWSVLSFVKQNVGKMKVGVW